jgi:hypothetical protein
MENGLRFSTSCEYTLPCWNWDFHSVNYEEYLFWAVTPFSLVEVHRHFGGIYWLHFFTRYLPNMSSIPKTEAGSYSETSVNFYRTTWHHIPESFVWIVIEFMETEQFSNAVTRNLLSMEVRHILESLNVLRYMRNFLCKTLIITDISIIIACVHKRYMSHHFMLGYFIIGGWEIKEVLYSISKMQSWMVSRLTTCNETFNVRV